MEYKFEDFIYEIANERGSQKAKSIIENIDLTKEEVKLPIQICSSTIPWLKDLDPELYHSIEDLVFQLKDKEVTMIIDLLSTVEEAWWEGFENTLANELVDDWFVHGDEGDGSVGYICNGTCKSCKEQTEV